MDKKERETELNTADIERYLELHKKEIMEHLTSRLYIDHPQAIRITNEPFEALRNEVMKDVPFGIMIHFALANAVMYSYWCGHQFESLKNNKKALPFDFKDEYIGQIQKVIINAFEIGRKYANEKTI